MYVETHNSFLFEYNLRGSHTRSKRFFLFFSLFTWIIICLLILFLGDNHQPQYLVFATLLSLGIYSFMMYTLDTKKYMIYYLRIADGQVLIRYRHRDKCKEVTGLIENLTFKKLEIKNHNRNTHIKYIYLYIYLNGMPIFHQSKVGPWTESLFDKVIFYSELLTNNPKFFPKKNEIVGYASLFNNPSMTS